MASHPGAAATRRGRCDEPSPAHPAVHGSDLNTEIDAVVAAPFFARPFGDARRIRTTRHKTSGQAATTRRPTKRFGRLQEDGSSIRFAGAVRFGPVLTHELIDYGEVRSWKKQITTFKEHLVDRPLPAAPRRRVPPPSGERGALGAAVAGGRREERHHFGRVSKPGACGHRTWERRSGTRAEPGAATERASSSCMAMVSAGPRDAT